ncbi:MAG: hypothetical protein WA040_01495 [Anaerolineae bacterium]
MGRTNHVEVDQSGRMEMSGETIVAVANGFAVTVRITAEVKGVVREALRHRGVKARMIMIRMFVGAIVLAVQDHLSEFDMLTIDEEYIGYETEVKSLLLDRLRSQGHALDQNMITIERVGKKSPAHHAAIRVTRRQTKADKAPTASQLLAVC